jgi:hypothetical protein
MRSLHARSGASTKNASAWNATNSAETVAPPESPRYAAMSGVLAGAMPDASSSRNGTASSANQIRSVNFTALS